MIRVLLADRHPVVRAGLEQLLGNAADIQVVGSAGDGHEAVAMAAERLPDVALVDLAMTTIDGVEATRRIAAASPRTRVIILTAFSDRGRLHQALDAGAAGYLLKDVEPEELLAGIRSASLGGEAS